MAVLAQGARIWVPDDQEVWQKASVVSTAGGVTEVQWEKDESRHPLPSLYYLRNEEQMTKEGIKSLDDLTQLTHLHEAALLHSLHERFEDDSIYTFTGPILIAVNPFKRIPGLYDEDTLKHFIDEGWRQTMTLVRKPHVFSTAVDAYRGLCKDQVNQTILISGESGAGKTESTKFVMKLLALAGSQDWQRRSPVENQVLQSNPLLEAFGNAKTLRNDNSSRFGKFIEMQFRLENDRDVGGTVGRLAGARIQTYLLESVRVCRQLQNERNYHAFYQLASMIRSRRQNKPSQSSITIDRDRAKTYGIDLDHDLVYDLSDFEDLYDLRYLNSSGCQELKGVDDTEEFERTALAMNTVGISVEEQQSIWQLVGCVLLIGGLYFGAPLGNSEASEIPAEAQPLLKQVSALLQVPPKRLEAALCNRTIIVTRERYEKPLTVVQAEDTRDALARALYGTMFLRIVYMTNKSIGYQDDVKLFAGVLDIFGFECFEINSFEQLCINFTNERLQQFFNTFIFKCEEALYREEGIAWDPLDFPDNQDCVDLMSAKGTGIFAMLDEECLVPKGSDQGFCGKLKQTHKDHRRFGIIKTKADWFTVGHFAGPVHYCSKGFLDKNRDQLSMDVQDVIKSARNRFVAGLFNEFLDRGGSGDENTKKQKKQHITVSLEFRTQLSSLMDTVQSTAPHFIRCVKPNPRNRPDLFHRKSVAEQLRYAGVLQAVQVSRAGYPVRDKHKSFFLEYRCLLDKQTRIVVKTVEDERKRVQQTMEKLEEIYQIPVPKHGTAKSWAVGASLVFLKHEAYQILSTRRYEIRQAKAVQVQAYWKMYVERRAFLLQRAAAVRIQCGVRCWIARRRLRQLRENRSQIIIASYWKRFVCRRRYLQIVQGIISIQSTWRMHVARVEAQHLRQLRSAIKIQSIWRMHRARVWYLRYIKAVILAQLRWKQIRAKRQLRELKMQARNAANLAAQKEEMAARLKDLHSKLQEVENEKIEELARLQVVLAEQRAELEKERANARAAQAQLFEATSHIESAVSQASGTSTQASPKLTAPAADETSLSRENRLLRQQLEEERERCIALQVQLEGQSMIDTGTSMSPKMVSTPTTASLGMVSSRKETASPAMRVRKSTESGGEEDVHVSTYLGETPGASKSRQSNSFADSSPTTGIESAASVMDRTRTDGKESATPSSSDGSSPVILHEHVYTTMHPESDSVLISELEDAKKTIEFLEKECHQHSALLNQRELELANAKRAAHEAEQTLQTVLPVDCGSYINQVLGFLKASPDLSKEEAKAVLRGDVLLVGDVAEIGKALLSHLEFAMKLEELNFKRLEEMKHTAYAKDAPINFQLREFDLQVPGTIPPIRFTAVNWFEIQGLSPANLSRLQRHFHYVLLCVANPNDVEEHISHDLWRLVNVGAFKGVASLSKEQLDGSAQWTIQRALMAKEISFLTPLDIRVCLPQWGTKIRGLKEELNRDLTKLMEVSMKSQPGVRNKSSSPISKAQAATAVNNLIWNGVSSFFGRRVAGASRGIRSSKLPPPPVTELLTSSLNGDECLLAESRDRDKALKHGELLRWYSIEMVNKAAVTCLKFGNLESKDFYLLAVATKAGTITTYKIRRTDEEKSSLPLGSEGSTVVVNPPSESQKKKAGELSDPMTCDPNDPDWDAPPELAVETWRQFDEHARAVTSMFFNQTGTILVSTSIDNSVRFWDMCHGYLAKIFSDSVPVLIAAFLPTDPRLFLTSNSRQVVRLVDSEKGSVVQRMKVDSEIRAFCFDRSGLNLIAGTKDGALETYEIAEKHKLSFVTRVTLGGATHAPITCVRFCSGPPPFVVVNSCDNTITIATCMYALSNVTLAQIIVKQRLKIPHTCVPLVSCLVRKEDEVWLVSGSEDNLVKVHVHPKSRDPEFQLVAELKGHETAVLSVDVNNTQTILASSDVSGCVHLWRRVSYKHLKSQVPAEQLPEATTTMASSPEAKS